MVLTKHKIKAFLFVICFHLLGISTSNAEDANRVETISQIHLLTKATAKLIDDVSIINQKIVNIEDVQTSIKNEYKKITSVSSEAIKNASTVLYVDDYGDIFIAETIEFGVIKPKDKVVVFARNARLFGQPDSNSKELLQVPYAHEFEVEDVKNSFIQVTFNHTTGWIDAIDLKAISVKKGDLNAKN